MKISDQSVRLRNELKKNEDVLVIAPVEDLVYAWARKNNLLESMRSDYSHYSYAGFRRDDSFGARSLQSAQPGGGTMRPGSSVPRISKSAQPTTLDFVKSYIAGNISTGRDIQQQLYPLIRELGLGGRVVLKKVKGVEYVIIKGYAGLRSILTSTRYLGTNPKILQLGIGTAALKKGIRSGGLLTCVLTVAIDLLQVILGEMELRKLGVVIVSNLAKAGITAVLTECIALLASGSATISTFACGPIIVAIGAGVLIGLGLEKLDNSYGLTDKLAVAMEKTAEKIAEAIVEGSEKADAAAEVVSGSIVKGARGFIYRMCGADVFRYSN